MVWLFCEITSGEPVVIFSELPQTATRQSTNSTWAMMALRCYDPSGSVFYSVTVLEFRGRTRTRRVVDRYRLEPTEPEQGPDNIAFLCAKLSHFGDEDTVRGRESASRVGLVYRCEISRGEYHKCDCDGGRTESGRPDTAPCVHVLCARTMAEEGAFDEDETAAPTGRTSAGSGEWGGRDSPADDWWAEAAGGRRVVEPAGL